MIDTHCHLEMNKFDDERDEVLRKCGKNLKAVIVSSAEINTAEKVLQISENNENIFSTLGLHPEPALKNSNQEIEEHIEFIRKNAEKIVGIGEVGLDYYLIKDKDKRERTKEIFERYVELAEELSMPLVIHARDSINDVLDILKPRDLRNVILHCFSGSIEQLKEALERNYWISISTLVCKSSHHKKLTNQTPLDNILLETDAPYLSPDSGTNYPWKIEQSARKIAQIKGFNFEKVWKKTGENAIEAFDLPI
ncbi:MAG: TatD family hydrolase [Candidatus Aenigmatarchaeota archaeon]